MRVKFLHMKQLTALKTATSSRSFNVLSSYSWWRYAQAGMEWDRFGLVGNTVPFGNFGLMERAPHFHMKGFALRLVSKQRHKRTRKWPIWPEIMAYSFCFLHGKIVFIGEDHLTFEWLCGRFGTSTYFCNPFMLRKFLSAGCVYSWYSRTCDCDHFSSATT